MSSLLTENPDLLVPTPPPPTPQKPIQNAVVKALVEEQAMTPEEKKKTGAKAKHQEYRRKLSCHVDLATPELKDRLMDVAHRNEMSFSQLISFCCLIGLHYLGDDGTLPSDFLMPSRYPVAAWCLDVNKIEAYLARHDIVVTDK